MIQDVAALPFPFDLERAKSGEEIECYFSQLGWISCKFMEYYPTLKKVAVSFSSFDTHDCESLPFDRLRMKTKDRLK